MGKSVTMKSLLLGSGILCGCSVLPQTVTVDLKLPPLPPELPHTADNGSAPAVAVYENSYGVLRKTEIPYSPYPVSVEIRKKENAVVLVYPPFALRPCGGFFNGSRVMELSWKGGFLAETVSSAGFSTPKSWNPEALTHRIDGNPWFYDPAALRKALETGTVGYYTMKKKPLYPVLLKEIPPGIWINRYPHDRVIVDSSGEFRTELPLGYEKYFNPEQNRTLSLYVTENGKIPFMLTESE